LVISMPSSFHSASPAACPVEPGIATLSPPLRVFAWAARSWIVVPGMRGWPATIIPLVDIWVIAVKSRSGS
jgi:hypothetical protein